MGLECWVLLESEDVEGVAGAAVATFQARRGGTRAKVARAAADSPGQAEGTQKALTLALASRPAHPAQTAAGTAGVVVGSPTKRSATADWAAATDSAEAMGLECWVLLESEDVE